MDAVKLNIKPYETRNRIRPYLDTRASPDSDSHIRSVTILE